MLSAREAVAIEPALSDAKGLVGVIHTPGDSVGDPERFCRALTEALVTHHGVTTAFGADIRAIAATNDGVRLTAADGRELTGQSLVVALGPRANGVPRSLGVRAPIQPMKGYSITAAPGKNAPRVSLTDTSRKIVFRRLGNRIRVAGGAEVGNADARVDPAWVRALIDRAPLVAERARRRGHRAGLGQAAADDAGRIPDHQPAAPQCLSRRRARHAGLDARHGQRGTLGRDARRLRVPGVNER